MIKKIRIYMEGFEPILYYKIINKDIISEVSIGLFYPFRRLKLYNYNRDLKKRFKKIGYPIKQCEGCGDGWAEWTIKDPNNNKNNMIVCQHCVGFYDWNMTRKRLEAIWELNGYIKMFNR